jgi:hypothetical protein
MRYQAGGLGCPEQPLFRQSFPNIVYRPGLKDISKQGTMNHRNRGKTWRFRIETDEV